LEGGTGGAAATTLDASAWSNVQSSSVFGDGLTFRMRFGGLFRAGRRRFGV
jgi:hypothetical protein